MDSTLIQTLAADPSAFRNALLIDTGTELRPLGEVVEPWQRADFEALDPAWQTAAGRQKTDGTQGRGYLERPRGHSKTSDLAVMATWALAFAPRKITGAAAAGDRDQARILRDAIDRNVRANPWLEEVLDIQNYRVVNRLTGSVLDILAADVHSSYGLLLDFLLIDEITNWHDSGERLWDALFSTVAKRKSCLCVIISNAGVGMGTSWQWKIREVARTNTQWHFSRLDGPQASWIDHELLQEQQLLLPNLAYRRLWLNEWTTGAGDALAPEEIDAAFAAELPFLSSAEKGWTYAAGLDLSVSRDHSALAIVGKQRSDERYRLVHLRVWRPGTQRKIDQEAVEEAILAAHTRFRLRSVACDPFQAEYLVSRLNKRKVPVETRQQTGKQLVEQASMLIEQLNSYCLDLPRHTALENDLRKLQIEERSYGFRLVSTRDEHGHGDTVTALSIALVAAKNARPPGRWLVAAAGPPSDEEVQRSPHFTRPMTPEFRRALGMM